MEDTKIYPFCYKIKENCPPCPPCNENSNCVNLLAHYISLKSNKFRSENEKQVAKKNVGNCLKKFGDMYKKVGIELYVNPKTKQIIFPDHERILANYNLFLDDIGINQTNSPYINELIDIYQILLNDKLREVYNDFYKMSGFAELESIMPKEYGIARILGRNIDGGKKRRKTLKKKKLTKRKKRTYRKN